MEIKNCPFCGDKASLSELDYGHRHDGWQVECDDDLVGRCGAEGPVRKNGKEAIEAWNRRLPAGKSVEAVLVSKGLVFLDAFKMAISTRRSIRRSCWFTTSMLNASQRTLGEWRLICFSELRNWSGDFSPSIEDLEASDWEVV